MSLPQERMNTVNPSICIILDSPLPPEPLSLLLKTLATYGLYEKDFTLFHILSTPTIVHNHKKVALDHAAEILNAGTRLDKLQSTKHFTLFLSAGKLGCYSFCDGKNVSDWRGSILSYNGTKFISTYSPLSVEAEYSLYPIFAFDIQRAIKESSFTDFNYPIIDYRINPLGAEELLKEEVLSVDIETTRGEEKELLCIGFGCRDLAYVFSFTRHNDSIIREILKSEKIKKIFHHGAFDINVLLLKGYEIKGAEEDTIIQAQILEPELPRSLAYLNSVYTRLPYYKEEGRSNIPEDDKSWKASRSKEDLFIYNARDVWSTYQIWKEQTRELKEFGLYDLYRYEMESHQAAIELSQNGILLDVKAQEELRDIVEKKRKGGYILLARLTGFVINPRSPKDVPELLYNKLKLPEKRNRAKKLTTDEDAIVSLLGYSKNQLAKYKSDEKQKIWMTNILILKVILELRGYEKLLSSYINIKTSQDGRVRSIFKVHATETGRWAASKFVDETGLNLQTIPRGEG